MKVLWDSNQYSSGGRTNLLTTPQSLPLVAASRLRRLSLQLPGTSPACTHDQPSAAS